MWRRVRLRDMSPNGDDKLRVKKMPFSTRAPFSCQVASFPKKGYSLPRWPGQGFGKGRDER